MGCNKDKSRFYSAKQGKLLLTLARESIRKRLKLEDCQIMSTELDEELEAACFQHNLGNFVTLKLADNLRGCIGNLQSSELIPAGIKRNAINAAFNDSRFQPLIEKEFGPLKIDISILTQPMPLVYEGADNLLENLHRGIDGVVIRKGATSATFLPQVWQQLPKAEVFLSQLCCKAGLSARAWQSEPLDVSIYQVQHISE